MTKGTSTLHLLIRNSPRKSTQESVEANGSNVGTLTPARIGAMTPARKALTPIVESVSNPLTSDGFEATTPSKKTDTTTPKKRTVGNNLFPDSENVTDLKEGTVAGTSSKLTGLTPGRSKNILAGFSKKSPAVARSIQETCPSDTYTEENLTPRRRLAYNSDVAQTVTSIKSSTKAMSDHPTPKSFRSAGRKGASETEVGTSYRCGPGQLVNGTPSSSRTARSLKYGVSAGTLSSSLGPSHIRASVSLLNRQLSMSQATQQVVEQHFDLVEDPQFWEDHNVQVLIRTRPINNAEMASQGFTRCLRQESPQTISWLGPPESRFTFDHVAGDIVTQEKLFQVAGLPMVENCISGYNSCMFAYGQTGSGKTHTMLGDIENIDRRPSENRGMTPRVFEYLFERIRKEEELRKDENLMFMCRCSFLEIYNEQITDLLEPASSNLHMREDTRTGVYVENLSEVEVHSVQDVIQLLIQGASNRRVAATNMNRESSRSHSVFTCIVESKWERDSMTNIRFGRLNLVDLAGSERQKSSGAEGERLKEAASINKSLSTLGLVIMILVDVANGKQRHVPYRDSKLTFLLQDSLGGNSKTTIIATVSPASCNAMETLSTLKFAQRAKLIRNTAVINEDASGDVKALRLQLQLMKEELDRIRRQSISSIPSALLPVDRSWDATRALGSPTGTNKQLKAMESIVAGALRREKAAEENTKRLAAEIEQFKRLVQQREEESQSGKMVLRFREEKIKSLEALSQGLLEVDTHLAVEKNMLSEEIKLLKSQMDCNPELTRFAMENIRLLDELKSLKEFQEGKQQVMAQEISNLRDKLLEVLEGKIAYDQTRSSLSTSQGHTLTSEIAVKDREIELLRTEAVNYRSELDHCRSNLNSALESNAAMASQVDDLQALIEQLRKGTGAQGDLKNAATYSILELQQVEHLQQILEFKSQLEQMESKAEIEAKKNQHLESQLKNSLQEAHDLRNLLQELTPNTQELERRTRMEMEEPSAEQRQRLTDYEAMAVVWNQKEPELRAQLEEVQCAMDTILEKQVTEPEELLISQEETRRLQMELVSSEASRNEELALRERLEKENNDMALEHSRQLEETLSKLAEERAIVEALESQQVLSINEIEKLQESNEKILTRLRRREEKERLLKKKINRLMWELTKEQELRDIEREVEEGGMLDEEEMMALELKLENARKELEIARELNAKFQGDQDLQKIMQQDLDFSRSEAETETALVITSMQDELMAMEDERTDLAQRESAAQEQLTHLREELTAAQRMLDDMRHENVLLRREHEAMKNEKDAEIRSLQKSWETASGKLIDYLADGDQVLLDAVQEMEELVELSQPSRRVQQTSKNKAHQFLREQLQLAQDVARETESKVRELARRALETTAETDNHTLGLFDENNVRRLLRDSLKFEQASIELTAEKEFTDSRITECETMLLAMQDDLAHAEMKLCRAEERNLELSKAQEALAVTNQAWLMEKATLVATLREMEEQYFDVQHAHSTLQTQLNSAKCREEVLLGELEELHLAKEKCDSQKRELENELVDIRATLEKHIAEDMNEDTYNEEELRISQNMLECADVTALLKEIETLNRVNQNLEHEGNKAVEEARHLVKLMEEKDIGLQDTNDALIQLKLELQEAVEAHGSHQQHSMRWESQRKELITECASLEKILDVATSNTQQAEEKVKSLEILVQEFSLEEEKWKIEVSNLTLQVEGIKSRLADKEAECKAVKNENERLQAALLSVQKQEASATCDLIALKQKIRRSEAHENDDAEHAELSITKGKESFRRQREVEVYEDEITKLMTMVAQTEERLAKLESDWRREKEMLLAERDIARLDANQRGSEAATLARNFESNRATLREAEMMVDALVQAKDSARSDAEGWKLDNERVRRAQEVAINSVYEETLEVLAITKEEVDTTIYHCEKEMGAWAEDLQKFKGELMDGLHISTAALREDLEIDFKACQDKFAEALEKAETRISSLTEKLRSAEEIQQNHNADITELQSALMDAHQTLHQSQAEVYALKCMLRDRRDSRFSDHEGSQEGLDMAQVAVSKLQASVAGKDADLLALHVKLDECHSQTADIERNHQSTVTELQAELVIKVRELDLMKEELAALNVAAASAEEENVMLRDQIEELRTKAAALEAELEVKVSAVKALEQELQYAEKRRDSMLQEAEINMKEVESQRDSLRADLLALKTELELAQRADKDAELEDCQARISNLMLAAEGQATEYNQKLKELASMVEQVKVEDRRLSSGKPSTPKGGEKSKSPLKGPGSPFSCIGKGMSQQRTAELGAELSSQERRIEELENLAASRQREIFILNTRLAEAESQTHDVIRELLGVKLDISNYAETQQVVHRLAEDVRRRNTKTPEKPGKNLVQGAEIEDLRVQLNELIEERESWLEDLNRRHAEIVASRISADKMRQQDQVLSTENEKLKLENAGFAQRITELEKDIKKLSGQQNLQQRIHHHAKIKDENTTLRRKTEDLSAKLRRTEILYARVNDELAKYRTAEGKTPFLNIDEEQCLRSKLQEAEDAKIQMAQKLITLYSSIIKAADFTPTSKEVDHASALLALNKLTERMQSTEQELADMKFKSKMAGERRRMSDLRAAHSPFKSANISGPQVLFCPSPTPR